MGTFESVTGFFSKSITKSVTSRLFRGISLSTQIERNMLRNCYVQGVTNNPPLYNRGLLRAPVTLKCNSGDWLMRISVAPSIVAALHPPKGGGVQRNASWTALKRNAL